MYFTNDEKQQLVKIAVEKSLLKEYNVDGHRTVYLSNGDNFQIQIFNDNTYTIGAEITINGEKISESKLVIRPGERCWLERYLDEHKKFVFNTYEVEDCNESVDKAIANNGVIKVKLFKEMKYAKPLWQTEWCNPNIVDVSDGVCLSNINCSDITTSILYSYSSTDTSIKDCSFSYSTAQPKMKETGRVDKGGYSSQTLNEVYADFLPVAMSEEEIHIMPKSMKPITNNDLQKLYCTECGRKISTKYKFCPFCGHKVE